MSDNEKKVRRILHIRFSFPGADPAQLRAMVDGAALYLKMFGSTSVRLLRNADNPGQYIQVIEYETHDAVEVNRQRLAGDPSMQAYLQAWRAFVPQGTEIDVYHEVAG